jgi:hypothetical protein
MLLDIVSVSYVGDYKLILLFENGEKRLVDLKDRLIGPIFEPLKDVNYFKTVFIDKELGTIAWPNGADKAPDTLYRIGQPV